MFNLVKEGDLFIYRRLTRSSENGEFYFFGAGKIDKIKYIDEKKVIAEIVKRYPFEDNILQSDLEDFEWKWKERGEN